MQRGQDSFEVFTTAHKINMLLFVYVLSTIVEFLNVLSTMLLDFLNVISTILEFVYVLLRQQACIQVI